MNNYLVKFERVNHKKYMSKVYDVNNILVIYAIEIEYTNKDTGEGKHIYYTLFKQANHIIKDKVRHGFEKIKDCVSFEKAIIAAENDLAPFILKWAISKKYNVLNYALQMLVLTDECIRSSHDIENLVYDYNNIRGKVCDFILDYNTSPSSWVVNNALPFLFKRDYIKNFIDTTTEYLSCIYSNKCEVCNNDDYYCPHVIRYNKTLALLDILTDIRKELM